MPFAGGRLIRAFGGLLKQPQLECCNQTGGGSRLQLMLILLTLALTCSSMLHLRRGLLVVACRVPFNVACVALRISRSSEWSKSKQ